MDHWTRDEWGERRLIVTFKLIAECLKVLTLYQTGEKGLELTGKEMRFCISRKRVWESVCFWSGVVHNSEH